MATLEELKSQLEQLKSEFQSKAIFNQEELERRQAKARGGHDPHQSITDVGIRPLLIILMSKLEAGYTYSDFSGSAHQWPGIPTLTIILRKPQEKINSELSMIDADTHQRYLLDIESAKEDLISKIAELRLDIADAEAVEKDRRKREASLTKELAKVKAELLSDAGSTQEAV